MSDALPTARFRHQGGFAQRKQRGERVLLESANPDYKPLEFPVDEIVGAWPIVQTVTAGKVKKPS